MSSPAQSKNPATTLFNKKVIYPGGASARQREIDSAYIDYHEGDDCLFVTFEYIGNSSPQLNPRRKPFAFDFLAKSGHSIIGVKPKNGRGWYRESDLHEFLRSPELKALIQGFSKVFFYGSSMGGYAAIAFAEIAPGATVIAFQPQVTLKESIVPWENRFAEGRTMDWNGDFANPIPSATLARKLYVFFDPFLKSDASHVELLDTGNLVKLRVPMGGHRVPSAMLEMGILKQSISMIISGTLTEDNFRPLVSRRKDTSRYYIELANQRKNSEFRKNCLRRALAMDPDNVEAIAAYGKALLKNKEYLDAILISKQLPNHVGSSVAVEAYRKLGFPHKSQAILDDLILKSQTPVINNTAFQRIFLICAESAIRAGFHEQAKALLDNLISARPNFLKAALLRQSLDHTPGGLESQVSQGGGGMAKLK